MNTATKIAVPPVLNLEKLKFLLDMDSDNPGFLSQLLGTFDECCEKIFREFPLKKTNAEDVFQMGHLLKGMAGNLGAVKLEESAAQIEIAGKSKDLSSIDFLIRSARQAYDETKEEFRLSSGASTRTMKG